MTENGRIAATCFGGGALTTLVLLVLAPTLGPWALVIGLPFGALIGYLGLNFREVLRAIPGVAREAMPATRRALVAVGRFARQPRPMIVPFAAFTLGIYGSFSLLPSYEPTDDSMSREAFAVVMSPLLGLLAYMLVIAAQLQDSTRIAPRWQHRLAAYGSARGRSVREVKATLLLPLTAFPWGDGLRIARDCVANAASFWFWRAPRAIPCCAAIAGREIGGFVARLFRSVHSEPRVMCSVDVPLGALVTYALAAGVFGSALSRLPSAAVLGLALAGGLVTLATGWLINYQLIARRVLRSLPAVRS